MGGSSPTRWRAGVAASLNSFPSQYGIHIPSSHNASDGDPDIATHPGVPTAGGSGDHRPAFNINATSHQRAVPDHILDNPENFDDAPYVPPRVAQAELQTYHPALDPRVGSVYEPNHDIQHVRVFLFLFWNSTRN